MSAITLMSIFVVAVYEIAFITLKGATPGKMLFRFRVIEASTGMSPPSGSVAGCATHDFIIIPFVGTVACLGVCGVSLWWLKNDPNRQTILTRPEDLCRKNKPCNLGTTHFYYRVRIGSSPSQLIEASFTRA